ncbi:MAG: MBL fold metallo-hydrolase [Candidatus Levybacteria bacterium]|nr:MBL fold metallo-hydrolase [Candidatus Levybacteria bacterium]
MENIHWLGHASFFFNDTNNNAVYFIDPFQLENLNLDKADIIFITHAHHDHLSRPDIDLVLKGDTVIIGPLDVLDKIDIPVERKVFVSPGNEYEIKGFFFSTIAAYNNHPERMSFHPKENKWVGYVFDLNGQKIYHAGDTDFIEEMKALKDLKLDFALLPIGGTYTMDYKEAAQAANEIAARITIPMHYKNVLGDDYKEAEEEFKKLVTSSKVAILSELA